ncbi:MAG: TIGR01777 family oxidoreductase [Acidobacteriaceae bacterium]|nr:TIGR01777 family oxidoreductase [Acidobacteriaceae bacterium]MBV9498524.1 TIGR01777 family oxidoreductase [Acidobacteriaceae bacterium]
MNFLVTGATGFIGRNLVDSLLAGGHSVNYLARARHREFDSRAAFHCWNTGENPPLNSVPRMDAIIHLAGEPVAQRWNSAVKQRIHNSRVEGTRKLVAGIGGLKHKPAVLVSASAIGYYGDRGEEVLTETSSKGTGFLADLCADWEREATKARDFGLRVVSVRIGAVLGRGGGALPRMAKPFRFGLGGKLGTGRQWVSWVHLNDLVRLLTFAAQTEEISGPLNGTSPEPVTNAVFTAALGRAVHRPAPWTMPKFAMKLAMGELAEFLFDSARVLPEATEKAGFSFQHSELNETLRSLL